MGHIEFTEGTGVPHGRFEDEFLSHHRCSEWWYCTGYLEDERGRLYAFQYTLARVKIYGIRFHMMLQSITDFESGRHYYGQNTAFLARGVTTTRDRTAFGGEASIEYSPNEIDSMGAMELSMTGRDYELALALNAAKQPVWHCDEGKLQMGLIEEAKQVTYYFSFTNMRVEGSLLLEGRRREVTGKAWFDKQGGTYQLSNPKTNWEWFSLRFFDNEEIMLFSFPQTGYRDGTFIGERGDYRRLGSYTVQPRGFVQSAGYKFSNGWKVTIPGVKEEVYQIRPIIDGQFNIFFFESLAEIVNPAGRVVGYSFVELLPGAYNARLHNLRAFMRRR